MAIDPHAHLRDWRQRQKETLLHGLEVAYRSGLDAVFEMPNTNPALTSRRKIEKRIECADNAKEILKDKFGMTIFHGIYAGITSNPRQIEEVISAYNDLFPRVVGLKMFAAHSTGNMGITSELGQKQVYAKLAEQDYKGVLAVHCNKDSMCMPYLWNPSEPFTHTQAVYPGAEVESVIDQIKFAYEAGFKGTLHIVHITVPEALEAIEQLQVCVQFRITCGLTPHHGMFYDEMMKGKSDCDNCSLAKNEQGLLLRMLPPLRPKHMQEYMLDAALERRIDWIETDHAPHTLNDKIRDYACGIPGFQGFPRLVNILKNKGASDRLLDDITHNNIIDAFGIDKNIIPNTYREPDLNLGSEYEFDVYKSFS